MPRLRFEEAVKAIRERDRRYESDAYFFLRESLKQAISDLRKDEPPEHQHVTGPELLEGLREHALDKFGSMALPVLEAWGIRSSRDVGTMVYQLIHEGAFGRSSEDHPSDFDDWLSFEEAFQQPYRPTRAVLSAKPAASPAALDPPHRGTKPATPRKA